MTYEQQGSRTTQHRKRVHHHLRAALSADETAEKHFHIREAMQLLTIEER
ncbi:MULTISPECIES: hypothetical protein [Halorussus]|nr:MULTISPECIES: hypothetical protein [Halorussus]NHN58325.1 hypothetical protein [Halorussus sp. JP-T4]